jgi:hypothetical protein
MLIYPENEKLVFVDDVVVVVAAVLEPYFVSIVVARNSDLYNQKMVDHLTVLKQNHDAELQIDQNHE